MAPGQTFNSMISHLRLHKFLYLTLVLTLMSAVGTAWLFSRNSANESLKSLSENLSVYQEVAVPETADFCGEVVPTSDPDVHNRLAREIRHLCANKSAITALIQRDARYRSMMLEALRRHQIPEDFYYVAIAESGLSNGTSPRGAKGFWQFMPASASEYGLRVSETIDQRCDPVQATEAACQYFRDSYRMFGNWSLVAASYNMGAPGLQRKLSAQRVANYYQLDLSRETSRYLFRIVALKTVLENPAKYGIRVPAARPASQPDFKTIEVTESIADLRAFAESTGADFDTFRMLNPWISAPYLIVLDGESYTLRIPNGPVDTPELLDNQAFKTFSL